MAFRLGVDVGGTFTDLFLVGDEGSGTQYRVKTPSTPADPSEGVLVGVRRICEESGVAVGDLRNILHGTTVATNAVLESKGARVGLITTAGFRDVLIHQYEGVDLELVWKRIVEDLPPLKVSLQTLLRQLEETV